MFIIYCSSFDFYTAIRLIWNVYFDLNLISLMFNSCLYKMHCFWYTCPFLIYNYRQKLSALRLMNFWWNGMFVILCDYLFLLFHRHGWTYHFIIHFLVCTTITTFPSDVQAPLLLDVVHLFAFIIIIFFSHVLSHIFLLLLGSCSWRFDRGRTSYRIVRYCWRTRRRHASFWSNSYVLLIFS